MLSRLMRFAFCGCLWLATAGVLIAGCGAAVYAASNVFKGRSKALVISGSFVFLVGMSGTLVLARLCMRLKGELLQLPIPASTARMLSARWQGGKGPSSSYALIAAESACAIVMIVLGIKYLVAALV